MSIFNSYEIIVGNTNEDKLGWSIDFKKGVCKITSKSTTHTFKYEKYNKEADKEALVQYALNEFQGVSNIEAWIIEDVENLKNFV